MADDAGEVAVSVVELPADAPETFDSAEDALNYFTNQKPPAADGAEKATAAKESPDEGDAGPEEVPGEDEDADPEAETLPPIARPRSWSQDADDDWNALPRTRQEKIAANEQTREADITRRINDAAEKLKGVTAKEQLAEQARQQYEAKIKSALAVLEREQLRDFSDIKTMADITKMAQEDPFRKIQWDTHQQELAFAHAEDERVKGEKAKATLTERNMRRLDETAKLIEKIPELADKIKLDAAQKSALQLFRDVGYSDQELMNMGDERLLDDHRIQLIINDAMKFRALQSTKTAVTAKLVPPVQRPGSAKPSGSTNSAQIQSLTKQLASATGSRAAAIAADLYQLEKKSAAR